MARVLIVDDDPDLRGLLETVFESAGHEVILAPGGWNALERIEAIAPDLIVLDISLGDIEGMAVLRRVHANPIFRALPVVMMSAHNTDATRAEALSLGAAAFMGKPVDVEQLLQIVDALTHALH